MANIIDSLIVTLGLDSSQFTAGAKKTDEALGKTGEKVNKTGKDMEAWGKNAASSMSKLRNEVLGLLAVFTAGVGIKDFVSNTISSTASLGRMSANLNMSAKDLAQWQLANKNAGGSVEGMTAQLEEAQKAISDYRLGTDNGNNSAFRASGLAKAEDFKDADTLLRARSDAVAKIIATHGVDVGRAMASKFGISADTFNLLKQGAAAADGVRKSVEPLAAAQAAASVKAEEFRKKWDLVQDRLQAVGVNIVTRLLPILNRFADWVDSNQDKIEKWATEVVNAIERFIKIADDAAQSVGGWKNVLIALLALQVLSFVAPLFAMAAALAQVGTAMGVIGGAAGTGALAVLGKLAMKGGVGVALLTHTDDLNKNEDADLAKLRAKGDADFKARGLPYNLEPTKPGAAPLLVKPGETAKAAETRQGGGPYKPLFDLIGKTEGTDKGRGYNETLGYGAYTGGDQDLTGMTLNEIDALQTKMLADPANKLNSSAVGRYQATRTTLRDFRKNEKLTGDEKFDPAMQDRFAIKQIDSRVNGSMASMQNGLAGIWASIPRADTGKSAYGQRTGATSEEAQAALRGVQLARAGPGAAASVQVAQAASARSQVGTTSNSSTSETNIQAINVYTQATDADGVAKDMRQALNRHTFAALANTGLS